MRVSCPSWLTVFLLVTLPLPRALALPYPDLSHLLYHLVLIQLGVEGLPRADRVELKELQGFIVGGQAKVSSPLDLAGHIVSASSLGSVGRQASAKPELGTVSELQRALWEPARQVWGSTIQLRDEREGRMREEVCAGIGLWTLVLGHRFL